MNKVMKASLALTSASAIQKGLTEVESPGLLQLEQVGMGYCQPFAGWDLFDLKNFDALNRDILKSQPAFIDGEKSTLFYKICQPDWKLQASDFARVPKLEAVTDVPQSCGATSDAFLMVDGECQYTFSEGADFQGIEDQTMEDGSVTYKGFTLDMKSAEACGEGGNFQVTFTATCGDTEGDFTISEETECSLSTAYTGPAACKLYTFEAGKHLGKLLPFVGGFMLLLGLALTFYGAKLLFQLFGAMIFFFVSAVLFMGAYNLFLPGDSSIYLVVAVAFIAAALGVLTAIFTYKFSKQWAVPLLAAWGGIALAGILVKLLKVNNATAGIAIAVVLSVAFGFLATKMNKQIRVMGTAFVGASIVMSGLSKILGNDQQQNDADLFEQLFIVGVFFVTALGSLVQLYLFRDEDKEGDDDFMAQEDEGRTCGCF